jgi:hypothetical protein
VAESISDRLSDLSRWGIMVYAERLILARKSTAMWRMGHGIPVSLQLLSGAGLVIDGEMPMLRRSIALWRELLAEHKKWVYVPSAPSNRLLLTLGNALYPLEYALVDTPTRTLRDFVDNNLPQSKYTYPRDEARQFVEEIAPQMVIGVYRASSAAPPYMFYAHRDYAHEAAKIVMADGVLQEQKGFPLLMDLADFAARSTFRVHPFNEAYVEAGVRYHYLGESKSSDPQGWSPDTGSALLDNTVNAASQTFDETFKVGYQPETASKSQVDMARLVQRVLSPRLAAYTTGVKTTKSVKQWADGVVQDMRQDSKERLLTAYNIINLLLPLESEETVRSWFLGANPHLDDTSPARAIREGRFKEATAAARAFAEYG